MSEALESIFIVAMLCIAYFTGVADGRRKEKSEWLEKILKDSKNDR